ncbi:MAG: D-tyrosyl-tRNA(Tyr) deacylase [Clostridia bacterium]|nr:D-tyrosyl-tRNA(Tyr) deacylase [Clostridia bacterium]
MRFLIQRVQNASVTVDGKISGSIENGFLVLIGITNSDTKQTADTLIKKLVNLRVFTDSNDKMNLSIKDINGSLLLVSQFTLYADCKHGNRPGFTDAAKPEYAEELYNYVVRECKNQAIKVQTGEFGADMKVNLLNDGPVTIMLDSNDLAKN